MILLRRSGKVFIRTNIKVVFRFKKNEESKGLVRNVTKVRSRQEPTVRLRECKCPSLEMSKNSKEGTSRHSELKVESYDENCMVRRRIKQHHKEHVFVPK